MTKADKFSAYSQPRRKKNKPRKPINYPKRPLSGYLLFAGERRKSITKSLGKKASGKAKVTKVMTTIAKEWNALSTGAKKPYLTKGRKALAAHKPIVAAYKKTRRYREWREDLEDWREEQEE